MLDVQFFGKDIDDLKNKKCVQVQKAIKAVKHCD